MDTRVRGGEPVARGLVPVNGRRSRWTLLVRFLDSPGVKLVTRLVAAVTLGFFANLLSDASSDSGSLLELPVRLGWWIVLAPIGVAMLVFDLFSDLRSDRRSVEAERDAHRRSLGRIVDANERITATMLLLLAKSAQSTNFNIHLFYGEEIDGRVALVGKDRRTMRPSISRRTTPWTTPIRTPMSWSSATRSTATRSSTRSCPSLIRIVTTRESGRRSTRRSRGCWRARCM